jgi:DNA polymerase-3 subunit gamma/tau
MPADEIQLLYSICLHGKADLGLASDEYAALTMILLRLLAFKPKKATDGSAAEPSKKLEIKEERPPPEVAARPYPVRPAAVPFESQSTTLSVPVRVQAEPMEGSKTEIPTPPKAVIPAAPVLELTPLGEVWFNTVQQLMANESIGALVRELALQSQLISKEADAWVLQVDNALLANPVHTEKLQTALQTLEPSAQLQVQSGSVVDTPAKRLAQAANELQAAAEALILNDETVQQLMREFDAKIVPNSIKPIKIDLTNTTEKGKENV